ncbi:mRNA export factor-like protein [Hapsidospora chrysogenum ATCC 11550]|uniref:mRNA export factor-like protein n=1 Tax=Hapsidospora chrysogenum (strain ATCC 11550 / CBS 779.69 / DSM 880 / IAM 14645 / JCM 23072 / IMI 49137) TaxID=857340 RepID=A0A086T9Q9_HAPC1|nr:mRNA export factor-like protein [Hapsidospora chrysogenum ATCC 11550]
MKNATKRKFNSLLQGLGAPKTASERPGGETTQRKTTGDVESLLQKRRRLGIPQSNAGLTLDSSSTMTKLASSVRRPGHEKEVEKPLARFCPTDRAELLKRLATFNDITDWTPKPERVSEIEWARRGWVCHGKETVRCVLCHKELVVKLNRKEVDGKEVSVLVPSEIESSLVDKYVELIVSSHLDDCLWRKRGCDETLLRLSLASATVALRTLRERYDELCARKAFLPYEFNLRLPEEFNLDDILAELPPDFLNGDNHRPRGKSTQTETGTETGTEPPHRVALALALFGWDGLTNPRIGAVPNSASCHTCQRRLGLWMFKSKEVDDNGKVVVPAPMDYLDPVREHRFFCPWKNPDAQRQPGARATEEEPQPGWKVLLRTLENDAHLRSVYEGRPRSRRRQGGQGSGAPATPSKQVTNTPGTPVASAASTGAVDAETTPYAGSNADEEDEKEREAKDRERWARLKRVKSLFDIKGSRRSAKSASRPGTSQSTRTTAETASPST